MLFDTSKVGFGLQPAVTVIESGFDVFGVRISANWVLDITTSLQYCWKTKFAVFELIISISPISSVESKITPSFVITDKVSPPRGDM